MSDMSNHPAGTKKAVVHRMVMPNHTCPYGLKAVHLLKRAGYEVEDHHLTTREETDAFKAQHGVETTPQIFIGGKRDRRSVVALAEQRRVDSDLRQQRFQ